MKGYFFIPIFFCVACTFFKNSTVPEATTPAWSLLFDSTTISQAELIAPYATRSFYNRNNYQLIWSDSAGTTNVSDSIIYTIRSAAVYGLIPKDYHIAEIENLLRLPHSHERAVSLDIYLTDAFFALWHDLKHGRIEKRTLTRFSLRGYSDYEGVKALAEVMAGKSLHQTFAKREPSIKTYHAIKSFLQKMLPGNPDDTLEQRKINKLVVNMERCRWIGSGLGERYISVNVPGYKLRIIENDSIVLESKVIVGKKETPTPELESVVRSFIIYPYWHVPKSIVKEILPHIQQDTSYLKKHNYDVLNQLGKPIQTSGIDWRVYDAETFPYVLRQREGSENTMGIIKFIFSNNYGVYLHDTNARKLFSLSERSLSHGCIRVQKATDLARYLIKDDHIVSPEDLDQYLMLQRRMKIELIRPIPVYLQYFTCELKGEEIIFYNDIYEKDDAMIKALYAETDIAL